jgi:hypothetical protein
MTPTGRRIIFAADRSPDPDVLLYDATSGRYERHQFSVTIGGWAPSDVRNAYGHPDGVIAGCELIDATGSTISIHTWRHDPDAPGGIPGDPYTERGDVQSDGPLDAEVQLPAWYDGQGRQVMVRDVIVQFRKWNGNGAVHNKMNLQVRAEGGYQAGPSEWTDPARWVEPASKASFDGRDDSWRAAFGQQGYGNGFSLRFTNMAGVALREVIVLVNVRTAKT